MQLSETSPDRGSRGRKRRVARGVRGIQSANELGHAPGARLGDGLVDSPAHCERADAAGNVGSHYAALAWDQLNLQHALSFREEGGSETRKAIVAEKQRRLPSMSDAELSKLFAYSDRNDNIADRTLITVERRRREPAAEPINLAAYVYGGSDVSLFAKRSALANPSQEFDGAARDGFGGSERSLIDGASVAADLMLRASRGDWRKRQDVVADRARSDRPAGYPYSMATDWCIALEAWGAECRAQLASGARFPKAKGYGNV